MTLLIPYFGMLVLFGLYDSYWALIVTYLVFTLPYATIMITGYINTLPKDLDEAVAIDGGSTWCVLWRVLVPISTPGLVATAIYTFCSAGMNICSRFALQSLGRCGRFRWEFSC